MRNTATLLLLLGLSSVPAVSSAEQFTLDTKGVDMSQYYTDLQDCKAFAEKKSVAGDAVTGAIAGTVIGAAIGVALGDDSDWATGGAKWGAIDGAAQGAWSGYENKRAVLRNCLIGRGYRVLD